MPEQRCSSFMRLIGLLLLIALAGCSTLEKVTVWPTPAPVIMGAVSYDWPSPLVTDAVSDAVIAEGGAIIRIDHKPGTSLVSFAGPAGRYVAEIGEVAPNQSTVTLTHSHDQDVSPEFAGSFFAAVDTRLGLH